MDLYAGKSESHSIDVERHNIGEEPEVELEGASSQIVLKLVRPLLNKGYTLVMDNFYNFPLLTRILKPQYRTDTMGTLRLNREFLPDSLKIKKKTSLTIGEICSSSTNDVSVVVWRDSNLVTIISSFHPVNIGGREKYCVYVAPKSY
ncbi:hypothetical protein ABMA28_003298 [Loxostege sticticalis]|uniref:PiggyBac transposable element-derived protein domain-containing protein n=1 Tax=Loxostege sticticalis TaxID=481309 RepID=A0ABD0SW28_LOXSC